MSLESSRSAHHYAKRQWLEPEFMAGIKVSPLIRQRYCQLLYGKLCNLHPEWKSSQRKQNCLQLEKDIICKFRNDACAYSTACKCKIISLDKEIKANSGSKVIIQTEKVEMPNIQQFETLVHSVKDLETYNYIFEVSGSKKCLKSHGDLFRGSQKRCERCNNYFSVKTSSEYENSTNLQTCSYHFGKPEYSDGPLREKVYSCCGKPLAERLGCEVFPFHVFSLSDHQELNRAIPFTQLSEVEQHLEVVALDCEMVYTTIGLEVGRVSIMNAIDSRTILNERVRPQGTVIDYNTRYSNLTNFNDAKYSLDELKHEMQRLGISRNTILIGHSLENDLKALRVVHYRVIDTAILYPHPYGLPYRLKLAYLSRKYLSQKIQTYVGHDSLEDTKAALDLVLKRINS